MKAKGFTPVELELVVVIPGALAAIALARAKCVVTDVCHGNVGFNVLVVEMSPRSLLLKAGC